MKSILAQAGFALGTFNLVLYGVGAVVLLVAGIFVINFGQGSSLVPQRPAFAADWNTASTKLPS